MHQCSIDASAVSSAFEPLSARTSCQQLAALRAFLRARCGSSQAAFGLLDVRSDGQINSHDFTQGLQRLGYREDATAMFEYLANGSGLISKRAFSEVFGASDVANQNKFGTESYMSDVSIADASTDLQYSGSESITSSEWMGAVSGETLTKNASEGTLLKLSRNSSGEKLLHRKPSPGVKRCWLGAAGLQRSRGASTEPLRCAHLEAAAPEEARARVDIYVRLGRLEEQLAAEQQLRLQAQSRLLALEQKLASDELELQRRLVDMRPRLEDMVQQVLKDNGDFERTIVERAVSEAKAEACIVLADKLQEIKVHARSLVADVETKLAHDRATKMQTSDGRDVGDLAEQLDAHQSKLESLEISFRAAEGQSCRIERPFGCNGASFTKPLHTDVRELKQKYEELATHAQRQTGACAVQAELKSLICKLDNSCSDAVPNRSSRSAAQRFVSPSRNVQFSDVVEQKDVPAKTVNSSEADSQIQPDIAELAAGTDMSSAPSDSSIDKVRKLKEENLRLREQNVEMRENAAGIQRSSPLRGVYRSTSAEDPPRLLGRLAQQSSGQTQASSKPGIYRQQSSDASLVTRATSGIAQRAAPFTVSQSVPRQDANFSLTTLPSTSSGQQSLRQASMRRS